ncbi:MAG: hydroxymethylglutaryl-CoA lyase [Bacteroidota bacterium]
MLLEKIKLVECPRDAMQGWSNFIPTHKKIEYINCLLGCGFDTIDFGSFVSPKAIPQLADTKEVIKGLKLGNRATKLLAIVANKRGGDEAVVFDEIDCIGFPFSVSPTFQERNTNSTIQQSFELVETLQDLCVKKQKTLVIYISMGFGNPYGDAYSPEIVLEWVEKIAGLEIKIISVADTVGLATPAQVSALMLTLIPAHPTIEVGVHLHSTALNWQEKLDAALGAGCARFDGALRGIGGCPMAGSDLVGNMDSELMIPYFIKRALLRDIHLDRIKDASMLAAEIFSPSGAAH